MDGGSKRIKKFAFTSVCVYNRLRVDGALRINAIFSTEARIYSKDVSIKFHFVLFWDWRVRLDFL